MMITRIMICNTNLNSVKILQNHFPQAAIATMTNRIAVMLLEKLAKVTALPSLFHERENLREIIRAWAAEFPGGNLKLLSGHGIKKHEAFIKSARRYSIQIPDEFIF